MGPGPKTFDQSVEDSFAEKSFKKDINLRNPKKGIYYNSKIFFLILCFLFGLMQCI